MADKGTASHTSADKQSASTRQRALPAREPLAPTQPADGLQRTIADPSAARPSDILALQRGYGNRAVEGLLGGSGVQAKLQVGPAADAYEQEADRAADQVRQRKKR
jgi:hypothetical protein